MRNCIWLCLVNEYELFSGRQLAYNLTENLIVERAKLYWHCFVTGSLVSSQIRNKYNVSRNKFLAVVLIFNLVKLLFTKWDSHKLELHAYCTQSANIIVPQFTWPVATAPRFIASSSWAWLRNTSARGARALLMANKPMRVSKNSFVAQGLLLTFIQTVAGTANGECSLLILNKDKIKTASSHPVQFDSRSLVLLFYLPASLLHFH